MASSVNVLEVSVSVFALVVLCRAPAKNATKVHVELPAVRDLEAAAIRVVEPSSATVATALAGRAGQISHS